MTQEEYRRLRADTQVFERAPAMLKDEARRILHPEDLTKPEAVAIVEILKRRALGQIDTRCAQVSNAKFSSTD